MAAVDIRAKRALGLLVVVVVLGVTGLIVYYGTQISVTLDVGGDVRHIRTHAGTVREVLDDANVRLAPADEVWPPLDTRLSGGERITVRRAFDIALQADGPVRRVRTRAVHPLDVLAEQAIQVGAHDAVQVDGHLYSPDELEHRPWDAPAGSIRVVRSVMIKLIDGEHTSALPTAEADIGRALDAAGIALYRADRVTPDLSTPIYDGLVVRIERSAPVTILVDGQQLATRALGPAVGDVLAYVGIAPIGQDYTLPPLEAPFEAGMVIQLVRVTEKVYSEEQAIPFETIYRPDPDLALNEERVIQAGIEGRRVQQIRVRFEDGQEVSRAILDEWIVVPPAPRLIATGKTKESP